ncbi:MAG TPA: ATP-dependent zinc metalloprotease FtsH [Clostridiaceae bacterium]|nr:ATP-dependent zinc metalloprotease FtsH [Clostridiaceae bacterium]
MNDSSHYNSHNRDEGNNNPYESNDGNRKPNINRNVLLFYLIGFALIFIFNWIIVPKIAESRIVPANYSQFRAMVEDQQVTEVSFDQDQILFVGIDDNARKTIYKTGKMDDPDIINLLEKNDVDYAATIPEKPNMFLSFLLNWGLPILIIILLRNTMVKRVKGMQGGLFGKQEIKKYEPTSEKITFADVAGQEEAVDSLKEIVDYLKNPEKYSKVGAKCPKGALLVGPPGTGKTLIAKAVAGESHVPFYSMAGSEFVEMFVGRGAAKVRDLFDEAKNNAPCIIFIDEIDTIGKSRDTSGIGSNDEREQTLNQLLTEMDGFDGNIGIVVLAATNRPEVLDPALLRPGRFDRQIRVELPSLQDRVDILKVHAKDYVTEDNIDYELIARSTAGASGAQLANIMNEAALRAVREGQDKVRLSDIQESVEVVIAGEQKKQDILSPEEKEIVAYHEIGHALVAALQTNSPPVQKITIIPRTSGALGYTMQVPESEKNLYSKEDFETHITTLCGGRAAEEVFFNTMTNGASNDIERATSLAKSMVTQYGMTERFGMVKLQESGSRYMGDEGSMAVSQQTMKEVEDIVVSIIKQCHEKARELISNNQEAMTELSNYLLENETITGDEFMGIFEKFQM